MSTPIRVLVVDDHAVFVEGVRAVLASAGVDVVGAAATVADAVRLARDAKPDLILMDVRLRDGNGIDATAKIRENDGNTPVVVVSADASDEALMAAVEAGASGFIVKTRAASDLVSAVRRAAKGEMLVEPAVLASVIRRQRERARMRVQRAQVEALLTGREREVLRQMAAGADNKTIASVLGIGVNTVRGHVQSILEKLGAHSKLEAVVRAGEAGLIAAPEHTET